MVNFLEPAKGQKAFKVEVVNLFGGGGGLDITQYVSSLKAYSSLDHPFMTLSCIISDEDAILRNGRIDGDRALAVSITDGAGETIDGSFHINSTKTAMVNGRKALGVELICMSQEHIYNSSQKVQEWKFKNNPETCTNIIKYVFGKYIKGDLQINAFSSPAVNIDIPRQTPMQAISFLLERAGGTGNNMFVLYERFKSGKPKFFLDEVSELAKAGPKYRYVMTEYNMTGAAHIIDSQYVNGDKIAKILVFGQESGFDAHSMLQQGYASKEYVDIGFVNKICTFTKDKSQPVSMESRQMPLVSEIAKLMASPRETRTIYEPRNDDETYFEKPKLEDAYLKPKTSAAGFLNKRVSISTYGCVDIGPGDVVQMVYPINTKDPDRPLDPELTGNYLVLAIRHSVTTNGEVYSQLELGLDGQRG